MTVPYKLCLLLLLSSYADALHDRLLAIEAAVAEQQKLFTSTIRALQKEHQREIRELREALSRLKLKELDQLPAGAIVMWHGVSVPRGFVVCNGSNGSPDLRSRFVVAAGFEVPVGTATPYVTNPRAGLSTTTKVTTTTTVLNHVLSVDEMPAHSHDVAAFHYPPCGPGLGLYNGNPPGFGGSTAVNGSNKGHQHAATSSSSATTFTSQPAYYSLLYIMKV